MKVLKKFNSYFVLLNVSTILPYNMIDSKIYIFHSL